MKKNLLLLHIIKCFSQKSNSQSTLHESSYCTSHLLLPAFCNKIVKSADILKYYLHEVTVLQWMGLFTPQTPASFLISLWIQILVMLHTLGPHWKYLIWKPKRYKLDPCLSCRKQSRANTELWCPVCFLYRDFIWWTGNGGTSDVIRDIHSSYNLVLVLLVLLLNKRG